MATYNGSIQDDDPRYKEGISIMIPFSLNEKPENDPNNSAINVTQNEMP